MTHTTATNWCSTISGLQFHVKTFDTHNYSTEPGSPCAMAASSSTLQKQPPKDELPRQRVRELLPNLHLGFYRTGKLNAITDVPGVLVGMLEIDDDGVVEGAGDGKVKTSSAVNTGVTVIVSKLITAHLHGNPPAVRTRRPSRTKESKISHPKQS